MYLMNRSCRIAYLIFHSCGSSARHSLAQSKRSQGSWQSSAQTCVPSTTGSARQYMCCVPGARTRTGGGIVRVVIVRAVLIVWRIALLAPGHALSFPMSSCRVALYVLRLSSDVSPLCCVALFLRLTGSCRASTSCHDACCVVRRPHFASGVIL